MQEYPYDEEPMEEEHEEELKDIDPDDEDFLRSLIEGGIEKADNEKQDIDPDA